jgi:hypothetical protein
VLVAAGFAVGVSTGLGALAGAAVAIANALALRWLVGAMLEADPAKRAGTSFTLLAKTAVVLALSAALLFSTHIDPVGFAIGIGALVLGLVLGSAHHNLTAAPALSSGGGAAPTKGE